MGGVHTPGQWEQKAEQVTNTYMKNTKIQKKTNTSTQPKIDFAFWHWGIASQQAVGAVGRRQDR